MRAVLQRLSRVILPVIALSAGAIVLLSFVLENETLSLLHALFVEWTVIVVAFAILLGILNVLRVHARRIQSGQGTVYSLILIAAFLVVFIPGVMPPDRLPAETGKLVGLNGSIVGFAFQYVQRPLQATFFALAAFFVATAAWRVFRARSLAALVMLIFGVLVLLGSIQFNVGNAWTYLIEIRNWIVSVPAMAGARGILLGIVLGTAVTGLRFLLGIERPYSE